MPDSQSSRLDGWKAIADHLGRDPRTAQRWHRQRGMPVHHVPGSLGGTVFGYRGELDDWLTNDAARQVISSQAERTVEGSDILARSATHTGQLGLPLPASRRIALAAAAVVLLTGVAAVEVFTTRSSARATDPTSWELNGTALSALDAHRNALWTSPLPGARTAARAGLRANLDRALPVDIDGDGKIELVAVVAYTSVVRGDFNDAVVYGFSSDADALWQYRPNRSLTFAGREFGGPWRPLGATISTLTRNRVWLSFIHRTWWPSFVVGLGSDGTERLAFVNAGHIEALRAVEFQGRELMLAGGLNNEFMLPALAVFDAHGPAAASPQTSGSPFTCDNCPTGRPVKYLLFPRSDVNMALGRPFVSVTEIEERDRIGIIELAVRDSHRRLRTVYRLSSDLTPQSVAFSDEYWSVHRELSDAGKITHKPDACPERRSGVVVRVWQPATDWKDVLVGPTFAPKARPDPRGADRIRSEPAAARGPRSARP